MTEGIKTQTTAATVTAARPCALALGIWRYRSLAIERANSNSRSWKRTRPASVRIWGENSVHVHQRYDHRWHRDPHPGHLRHFRLGQHGQPDYRQDRQRVIVASSGTHLYCGIFGCHPLPCPQRRADCEESGVYRHWNRPGWVAGKMSWACGLVKPRAPSSKWRHSMAWRTGV